MKDVVVSTDVPVGVDARRRVAATGRAATARPARAAARTARRCVPAARRADGALRRRRVQQRRDLHELPERLRRVPCALRRRHVQLRRDLHQLFERLRRVSAPRCGDGMCNGTETCTSCPSDCGGCAPRCGDGMCNGTETCTSCGSDCGSCMMTGAVTDPCPSTTAQGPNRNCGWRMGVTFTCSPARATMVGCSGSAGMGSLCQPSYGVCSGDPVMRVCPGTQPCTAATALPVQSGSLDDQCDTCPSAYVTCPSSGQIHVRAGTSTRTSPRSAAPARPRCAERSPRGSGGETRGRAPRGRARGCGPSPRAGCTAR